jgi:hypothetical protein
MLIPNSMMGCKTKEKGRAEKPEIQTSNEKGGMRKDHSKMPFHCRYDTKARAAKMQNTIRLFFAVSLN